MITPKRLSVVVGGQYGSEAKGHVVQRIAERATVYDGLLPHTIRVAGPNAGHTGYDATGQPWALRQVPVAAVVPGHGILSIAPGSEIDLPVLIDELTRLRDAGLLRNKSVFVSPEATLITDEHKSAEVGHGMASESESNLVTRIGSTGKGIGAARADRLMRKAKRLGDDERAMDALAAFDVQFTPPGSNPIRMSGVHVIVEGTQGYGLGLHAGHYPQCTSSDCRAIDFLAMAGINPWEINPTAFDIWVVARIYPIRVAGNSGPLKDETTWAELGLPEERTTVTKKVRRVGGEDWGLVRRAVRANGMNRVRIALTMLDQKFPITRDQNPLYLPTAQREEIEKYLARVERETDAPIGLVTTGPNSAYWQ